MPLNLRLKSIDTTFKLLSYLLIITSLTGCGHYLNVNHYIKSEQQWQSPLLRDHPLVGEIIRTKDKQRLQPEQLIHEIANADYLLIGEKHDNPDHHHLQNWLLNELLPKGKYRLVFEMMNYDQQTELDTLANDSSEQDIMDASQLGKSGWTTEHYLPLMKTGLAKGAQLTAGNLPKAELMNIYKEGLEPLEDKPRFHTLDTISKASKEAIQEEIYQQHCKMLPIKQTTPMVNIQIAKDASLAFSMTSNLDEKSILIAGNYHVSKTVGVPKHLEKTQSNKKTLVIQIIEVSNHPQTLADLDTQKMSEPDFIWFTPKWTDKDYCDDMKNHSKK